LAMTVYLINVYNNGPSDPLTKNICGGTIISAAIVFLFPKVVSNIFGYSADCFAANYI